MNEKNIFNPECFYKVAKATSGSFIRCKNASLLTSFFNGIQGFRSGLVNVYLSKRQNFFLKNSNPYLFRFTRDKRTLRICPGHPLFKNECVMLDKIYFYFSFLAILDLTRTSTVTISQIIQTYLK